MKELWEQAILAYNLPLTIALGLIVLFWLVSIMGAVGMDCLDFDLDGDIDIDGGSAFASVLKLVNAHEIPTTLVISLLTLIMWFIAIIGNYYINSGQSQLVALGLLAGNFIGSCVIVKVITQPLCPFFKKLKKDELSDLPLAGSIGVVKSRVIDSNFGQVEVPRPNGSPALINCKLREGEESLVRGDQVFIYELNKEKGTYLVRPANELANEE